MMDKMITMKISSLYRYFISILFIVLTIILNTVTYARPVSYEDGWTAMMMSDEMSTSVHIHYSPTAFYSIGYRYEDFETDSFYMNAFQLNNLLYRRNTSDSQANLYLRSGLGIAKCYHNSCKSSSQLSYFTGIASDWETQRLFVSYNNRFLDAPHISHFFDHSARLGIAPYIGDYGDLHTWLMVQVDYTPNTDDIWTVTPLIRLFKETNLLELGINNRDHVLLNYVKRF